MEVFILVEDIFYEQTNIIDVYLDKEKGEAELKLLIAEHTDNSLSEYRLERYTVIK